MKSLCWQHMLASCQRVHFWILLYRSTSTVYIYVIYINKRAYTHTITSIFVSFPIPTFVRCCLLLWNFFLSSFFFAQMLIIRWKMLCDVKQKISSRLGITKGGKIHLTVCVPVWCITQIFRVSSKVFFLSLLVLFNFSSSLLHERIHAWFCFVPIVNLFNTSCIVSKLIFV